MFFTLRRILFTAVFNLSLFFILLIGIQNSSNKKKVNLIINETVNLPISFIVGLSFIGGSITSSFLISSSIKEKD